MTLETRARLAGEAARRQLDAIVVPDPSEILLRARRGRRARLAFSAAATATAIALVALALTTRGAPRNVHVNVGGGGPSGNARRVENRFVPPTHAEGNRIVMPVALPNGKRVELMYPPSLALAGLGFNPQAEASWNARSTPAPCCDRTILSSYMSVRDAYGDATPIKTYPGFDGQPVGLYNGAPRTTPNVNYLVYQFGPWLVEVVDYDQPQAFGDAMTDQERAIWARRLVGSVTPDGFLRLDVRAPLKQLRSTDDLIGAPRAGSPQVELFADRCSPRSPSAVASRSRFVQGDGEQGVAWCDRGTGFRVSITGPRQFVDSAERGLAIRPTTAGPAAGK
jgi:hypothetical protein